MALQFQSVFPIPKWLRPEAAALDFTGNVLRYVWLRPSGEAFKVAHWEERVLPEGLLKDGIPGDEQELINQLRELRKTVPSGKVRVVLPESQVYVFRIVVPVPQESDLEDAIRLKLEEYVPVRASDAHVTWHLLKKSDQGFDVIAQVIQESYLLNLYNLFATAGFEVLDFEYQGDALFRLCPVTEKAFALVVGDANHVTFFIAANKRIHFSTSAGLGPDRSGIELDRTVKYWDERNELDPITAILCFGSDVKPHIKNFTVSVPVTVPTTDLWKPILDLHKEVPLIPADKVSAFAACLGAALGVYK